jgi:hypothetical protein
MTTPIVVITSEIYIPLYTPVYLTLHGITKAMFNCVKPNTYRIDRIDYNQTDFTRTFVKAYDTEQVAHGHTYDSWYVHERDIPLPKNTI